MAFVVDYEKQRWHSHAHAVNVNLYSPWVVPDKQIFFDMSAWCKENLGGSFVFNDDGHHVRSEKNTGMIHMRHGRWRFELEEDLALFRLKFGSNKCKIYSGEFRL